ncbi:MAG: LemA family protein [Pseudomonadota bacterium]
MRRTVLPMIIMMMVIVCLSGCGYNMLQEYEEGVFKAWSDVESNLQRRSDLIPNLVEVVKGYAAHERETLQGVVEARSKAASIQLSAKDLSDTAAMQRLQSVQGELSSTLSRLLVIVERYPDLKANQNFLDLQNQLEGTENRINVARQRYNKAVERFNASIRKFPYNLTNSLLLHLERKEYYKADEGAKTVPKVKF